MSDRIGNVILNDSFYGGSEPDTWNGAAVLEQFAKDHKEHEYNSEIAREKNWAILFSFSHIRANLIEWLPIEKGDKILEIGSGYGELTGTLALKSGNVTGVEVSLAACRTNALRNREKEGITLYAGAFEQVRQALTGKYDWIILAGTLERSGEHCQGIHCEEKLLRMAKDMLSDKGRIVAAVDNRLGLKYFAGTPEAHSGRYFAGIEGYGDGDSKRSFSGPEFGKLLSDSGLSADMMYYPYPDHRLPMSVYSDGHLPQVGELWDNLRNFDIERYQLFDEKKAFDHMIQDGLFPVFSNSFLALAVPSGREGKQEKEVIFSRYSNERAARFAIRTDMIRNEDGTLSVRKSPCCPEGKEHIDRLPVWQEKLGEVYADSAITLNRCEKDEHGVMIEYLTGQTLEEELDELLLKGEKEEAAARLMSYIDTVRKAGSRDSFVMTPQFEEVFGEVLLPPDLTCAPVTDIDMVAGNAMRAGEGWIHMDYEWTFDFPIPVNYVIYRIIQNFLYGNVERTALHKEMLYKRAGLTEQETDQYEKMEAAFQNYITGDHVPLRCMYEEISPGCVSFRAEEENRREAARAEALANTGIEIFVDTFEIAMTGIHVNGWAVSRHERTVNFSLCDERGQELEVVQTEHLYRRDVAERFKLSGKCSKAGFHMECRLPGEDLKNKRFTLIARDGISEVKFVIPVEKLRLKQSRIGKKIMDLRGAKDVIRYIAPKEMGFFRESGQYRVEDQRFDTWRIAHRLTRKECDRQSRSQFEKEPLFSVILAAGDYQPFDHKRTIESVLNQTKKNVEVCIAAGPGRSRLIRMIRGYEERSPYVHLIPLDKDGSEAEACNEAIRRSSGEFFCIMTPGDVLEESAVFEWTKAYNRTEHADILYTDSDRVDWKKKEFFDPQFKPDYSPITLLSGNYIGRSILFGRSIAEKAGLLRSIYKSQAVYDLILRCSLEEIRVCHIPRLLYHESAPMDRSLKQREELALQWEEGRRVLQDHLRERGLDAEVRWANYPMRYCAKWKVTGEPKVSVIIPNQDHIADLKQCLSSIAEKTTYQNYEVLVVENNSREAATFAYYEQMQKDYPKVRLLKWEKPFNYSAINNFAVKGSDGEYLIFLNNDTEVLTPDWIEEMLMIARLPGCAVVGARLYYPDDTLQHAGVIIGLGGIAGHLFVKEPGNIAGYQGRACTLQNLSAVTAACMMTSREAYEKTGGFEERLQVALNDVDYCLKAGAAGYMTAYQPDAELYHYESKSRGLDDDPVKKARYDGEVQLFRERWQQVLEKGDPYYNPNLSRITWNCTLRIPPAWEEE